jgi:hypothetical protein
MVKISSLSSSTADSRDSSPSQSQKLYYDRRSVGQSALVSSTHLGLATISLLLSVAGFLMWGGPNRKHRTHRYPNNTPIVDYLFVAVGTRLQNRSLAMNVHSDFTVPVFGHRVTILYINKDRNPRCSATRRARCKWVTYFTTQRGRFINI